MKSFRGFLAIFFLMLLSVGTLGARTILIDTWENAAPAQMAADDRIRVVSAETGIMDMLFESGHIFFNIYSVPGETGELPLFSNSLEIADDIGADYVLKLNPDADGLSWTLFKSEDESEVKSGYKSLDGIDADLKLIERWTMVGHLVATDLIPHVI